MSSDNPLLTLLVTGQSSEKDSEKFDVDKAIEIISTSAQNPQELLSTIEEVIQVGIDRMVMMALAVFLAKADSLVLEKNTSTINLLFNQFGPPKLLELVELLKSKAFGKGFGSRPQKMIKMVMEGWSLNNLKHYSIHCPKQLYSLTMLVHPRYNGNRGRLIKKFLGGKKQLQPYSELLTN